MLHRDFIVKITCNYVGEVGLSTRPQSHQQFQRRRRGERFDQPGGGAELRCNYIILIKSQYFEDAMHILENCVPANELQERLYA